MRTQLLVCLASLAFASIAIGQPAPPQGNNPFPEHDNQWHLGYSVRSYASTGEFAQVKGTQMGDASAGHPGEVSGVYSDPVNKITSAAPPYDCVNTGPSETNACTFASVGVQPNDEHSLRYTYKNWGGRCILSLRILVYKPVPDWKWADPTPWSSGSPFLVVVPEGAVDAMVFGKLNGANIAFTPSDPLSAADANYFTLTEPKKVVPGLGTVYRFKTK